MKVYNTLNVSTRPKWGEKNRLPSMTIPDQSMSVKEIMDRYTRGLPIDGQKVPVYTGGDDDMPDPRTLDLAERQQLAEDAQNELDAIKERNKPKPKPKPQPLQQIPMQLEQDDSQDILKKPGVRGSAPENGPEGPTNSL